MDESMFEGLDGGEAEQLRQVLAESLRGVTSEKSAVVSKSPAAAPKTLKAKEEPVYIGSSDDESTPAAPAKPKMSATEQLHATAMLRKRKADAMRDAEPQVASFSGLPRPPSPSTSSAPPAKRMMGMSDLVERKKPAVSADTMRFPNGAIRMTRTPGRAAKNTITVEELVDPQAMLSGVFYAFFIAQDEFFDRLRPFKVPTYIGRDASQDMAQSEYHDETGESPGNLKTAKKEVHAAYTEWGVKHYSRLYGKNFKAFYAPKISGCSHSKIMLIEYKDFCRMVIASTNFMDCDFVNSDNLWFIQDFKRKTNGKGSEPSQVNRFFEHFLALNCPKEGIDRFRGNTFDFSNLKAQICLSRPGVSRLLDDGFTHGALRLLLVCKKILKKIEDLPDIQLEINTASLGQLTPQFLHEMHQNISGGFQDTSETDDVPDVRIVFPTRRDVEDSVFGKAPACNMGSHIKWPLAPPCLKSLLYHYDSTDPGMMFHTKLLLALDASDPDKTPLLMVFGSANFSRAAWGEVGENADKTESCSNYESNVIIPGSLITDMLEPDSTWTDIVPYVRPGRPYAIRTEKPWNSDTWVRNRN